MRSLVLCAIVLFAAVRAAVAAPVAGAALWKSLPATPDPTARLLSRFRARPAGQSAVSPTGLTRADYLALIAGEVDFWTAHQDERGAIIDPYRKIEWQYSTPAFAHAAALLVDQAGRDDLLPAATKAMDWSVRCITATDAPQHHEAFFIPMIAHAYPLLRPHVPPEVAAGWERQIRAWDPFANYRCKPGGGNWNVVALSGDALLHRQGLRSSLAYVDASLDAQARLFHSAWGNYLEGPMAYDHFPRLWAADAVAHGDCGAYSDALAEALRRGSVTSLFMQSPTGELPAGGRSAHHQWNEAEQCVTYEIYAEKALRDGDPGLASIYKRAARLSLSSMRRWVRPTGEMWIVKNRVDPAQQHGYEGYSAHSQYNLLPMSMLAIAWEHAGSTDSLPEAPCPADLGGYMTPIDPALHKVFANAGGMYIEIETKGDPHYNPTGLLRIHRSGFDPQLGPSDGLTAGATFHLPGVERITAAVGAAWRTRDGAWTSLAERGAAVTGSTLRDVREAPDIVSFTLVYDGDFSGPKQVHERYVVTPDAVTLTTDLPGYRGPMRYVCPVQSDDGAEKCAIEVSDGVVSMRHGDDKQTFTPVGAASVSVGETAYPWHNGWARVATAEYPAGGRITLRIAPVRAGEGTMEPDLATLKDRLRQGVLPVLPEDHAKVAADAGRYAGTLLPDGSWPEIAYTDTRQSSWLASQHMGRLLVLAKAWADAGGPLYHNADLGAKALSALSWWLDHDYPNSNWWWQQIGTPQLIGESALLLDARLNADQAAKLHTIMARAKYTPGQGQNTVWLAANVMLRGCLEDDPAQVADGFRGIWGEVHFATTTEGLQPDFSFHQHNDQFYNGGYGLPFGNDIARYIACADGTRWQAPKPVVDLITRYLLDAQQWMVRGRIFDFSAVGREITRAGKVAVNRSWTASPVSGSGTPVGAAYGIWNAAMLMARVKGPRQAEFAAFARRLGGDPLAPPLSGNRHFWASDYMAHQRPAWFASVRMFSTRTLNAEVVNAEGLRSHHLADGASLLYRTGEEYTDIFPCWDWEMVPGTTAERSGDFTPKLVQSRGKTSFVGGVSDGTYGCAAMDLWRGALTARKAWFFFDDQYVALGAGITDTSSAPVSTAVNQCRMRGPAPMLHALPNGGHWTWHDGVGYLFLPGRDVRMAAGPQTGRWSDIGSGPSDPVTMDVFRLWIEHGSRPSDASYAYVVEPDVNAKRAADDALAWPVRIVSNTPAVQAVHHPGLGVLQAAFYLPGRVSAGPGWTLSVDRRCLVMLRRVAGDAELSVSNPENEAATVNVEIDRPLSGEGCTPSSAGTRVKVDLPGGDRAGASVVRRLLDTAPASATRAQSR